MTLLGAGWRAAGLLLFGYVSNAFFSSPIFAMFVLPNMSSAGFFLVRALNSYDCFVSAEFDNLHMQNSSIASAYGKERVYSKKYQADFSRKEYNKFEPVKRIA